ncbi:efflux RND transporter periplasmic adaptor subunit [Mitsuaria sp. WAJ17]|uniref:HlyD family secretion protein n=1 Tax=Mitsuaria sp. WAJ17 TaxID=2761452 RepID=UPI001602FC92|nr:efflux RND transporter periplasmic adaptor subunit [Mitsuaria sp. WAJ17]MBB2486334.1 efflux RND transporter periplasmic adaptor subunit [Mitsuaria sp. WAJ17]
MSQDNSSTATPATTAPAKNGNPQRKKGLTTVAIALILGFGAYSAYEWLVGRHFEKTDNAYVQANVVQITPLVGGTVRAIHVDDTDAVKAGQKLVSLDPVDARMALDQAQAQLGQTVREVRTLFANNATLQAQVRSREADLQRARSEVARLKDDVSRREPLVATGAVGKEELDHARAQLRTAQAAALAAEAAAEAAREQLVSSQSLTDGTSVEQHPNVLRAAARVRETFLAVQRNELVAPVNGWVARRSVQLGQRVAAGTPLMSVVGLQQAWVDANFKEGQLARLRIGQPVTLVADVYGDKAEFHGKVVGLGAGTGAAFAVLPAQNATGNWIKVVQRVPVRIALDAKELAEHPLRVGLSMNVAVDVKDQSGKPLSETVAAGSATSTKVFEDQDRAADAEVQRIIQSNLGRAARPVAAAPKAVAKIHRNADALHGKA